MPSLKAILILPLIALIAAGFVHADDKLPPSPARMEQLLREWEQQSARLKTLEFSIYRIDRAPNSIEQHYEGHVAFKSPKLAYLDLKKVKLVPDDNKKMVPQLDTGKKRVSTPLDTTIWSGDELWHYRYDLKQVAIFRLDKDLGLQRPEEAPLPFVFNVKAADARKRYDLVLMEENPNQHLLKVTPKSTDDRRFSAAWIILDANSLLPTRILLLLPDKKSTEDFTLSHFQANQPVNETFFRVVLPGKPWKIERYPRPQKLARAKEPAPRRQPKAQNSEPLVSDVSPPR